MAERGSLTALVLIRSPYAARPSTTRAGSPRAVEIRHAMSKPALSAA